jgi:hypothetical protein
MSYNQYPSQHGSYVQSFANVEQGEFPFQDFPPAPIDFINWDDSFLTASTGSVTGTSVALPIQTSLSAAPVLPHSYFDLVANSSRNLPVAAPIPVPHAALTKAALRTMMSESFNDKGNSNYHIPLTKKLNWHERYLQDKENVTHNNFAGGSEPLKISTDARPRGDFDNHVLQAAAMNYNALMNSVNSKQKSTTGRPKLVIRPISPSTLMALTEPCLMAWCTTFDENLAEPGSSSACLPLPSSDYNNYDVDKRNKAVYNVWGY